MYQRPKNSNATVQIHDHATLKAPKGMTDKQTDKLFVHYSKIKFGDIAAKVIP